MTPRRVLRAREAAQEFIDRANVVMSSGSFPLDAHYFSSKETAALRRQSMELTRLLADMRRPDNGTAAEA